MFIKKHVLMPRFYMFIWFYMLMVYFLTDLYQTAYILPTIFFTYLYWKLTYFPRQCCQLISTEIQEIKTLKTTYTVRYKSDCVVVALQSLQENEFRNFLRKFAKLVLGKIWNEINETNKNTCREYKSLNTRYAKIIKCVWSEILMTHNNQGQQCDICRLEL